MGASMRAFIVTLDEAWVQQVVNDAKASTLILYDLVDVAKAAWDYAREDLDRTGPQPIGYVLRVARLLVVAGGAPLFESPPFRALLLVLVGAVRHVSMNDLCVSAHRSSRRCTSTCHRKRVAYGVQIDD